MYKLFLTFRYLTRKKIVLFPILVVWLCVMMLIIVSSIMGGFVERVRQTNHDLFGDIVISNRGSSLGWSRYEELQKELARSIPEIAASTPIIQARALIYFKDYKDTELAQLVGIDPAERSRVSRFRESLFRQYQAPEQAATDLSARLPATSDQLLTYARQRYDTAWEKYTKAEQERLKLTSTALNPKPNFLWFTGLAPLVIIVLWQLRGRRNRTPWTFINAGVIAAVGLGIICLFVFWPVLFPRQLELAEDRSDSALEDVYQAQRAAEYAMHLPPQRFTSREDLVRAFVPSSPSMVVPPDYRAGHHDENDPDFVAPDGCIIGARVVPLAPRNKRGTFVHSEDVPKFQRVIISVFPVSQKTGAINTSSSESHQFTVIDDSYTGVYDTDKFSVYAPFTLVQRLANMAPDPDFVKDHPEANFAPMCHQVLIKLKDGTSEETTRRVRTRIREIVERFQDEHPEMYRFALRVNTWDEEQEQYLRAVQNEKTMMTFILGLMSLVVLVVIFLIFYQIVRDKTRDIGIIKAVGGSEEGVAGIFLTYGLFVGIVGGAMGVISGVAFVTHTNEIHEWIYRMTGLVIWDRSVYIFDEIPNTVSPREVAMYFAIALVAGILGAFIPAFVAGAEDPVKAVRYE